MVNYGLTKKMMAVQAQAYKKQYGLDSIHLILTNLYGPGDSYNPERSHVVAALVRKWVEAEMAKAPSVEVWGTGKPIREFIYVEDCADAIVLAAEKYDDAAMPLNIGTGIGTSIRELAETINAVTGYRGKIVWNADKPDGAAKKVLDVTRMTAGRSTAGSPPTDLRDRPGQDDRLVPGQQGPGGRQVVNAWLRQACRGSSARAERPVRAARRLAGRRCPCGSGGRSDRPPSPARLLFVNQYYWPDHASTAQHLTDLAESLAAEGLRVPRPLQPGGLPAGHAAAPRVRGPQRRPHPSRPGDRRWGGGAR